MLRLKCIKKDCPNEKSWCYIVDGIHLKILPAQLKAWSMAINNDEATLDVAPENVVRALMPAKSGTKNPLRNLDDKAAKIPTSSFPSQSIESALFSHYPLPPYPYFNPYNIPLSNLLPQQTPTPLNSTVSNKSEVQVPSSPPCEQDPVERMIIYINWLAKRSPTQASMFLDAKDALLTRGYTFNTLQKMSNDIYSGIGIVDGIMIQIKTEVDNFKKVEAKGRL